MAILTAEAIRTAGSDEQLFERLSDELQRLFPSDLQADRDALVAALGSAPVGLRAMAAVHSLDVSMSVDDLAWHFANEADDRFLEETYAGLKVLGASEAAEIFVSAWEVLKPFLSEIRSTDWETNDISEYFERTGIHAKVEPLNKRLWRIAEGRGRYWAHAVLGQLRTQISRRMRFTIDVQDSHPFLPLA